MTPDARLRLPREPYPGLRPYLDFEAALLFGRDRQVSEIVDRLAATQFVAVLGGSGSGKSSLVTAGLTPRLRSYGIPGAGDLWLTMSCTPGTNASGAEVAQRSKSPVTALVRRFAALLQSRGSEQADVQRLTEMADVFRQEAGFARLIDTYGHELAVPPGLESDEARLLIVLDQFEEIFHPTNRGVDDARLLVERVLDHFYNPHPRCFVVLTMRSEFLNECAAFLELPDAINKSSYLVRRLDDSELRDVITGPAQRFLRLAARSNPDRSLPHEVQFEASVVERVLQDASAIAGDPDHLPLLQHLLARLWQAALEREEMDALVPSRVTDIDLARAVNASAGETQPLDLSVNTLRACVEHWPERIYQWHDAPNRAALEALLRHLAWRDPNTGQYSQQRIGVDDAALLLGPGKTRQDVRSLLAEGFLGGVDYLFWDDEDPERTTVKVSHESFIRGWTRFRALIDDEARRNEEFFELARRGAAWVESGQVDDLLLEVNDLRRLAQGEQLAMANAASQQLATRLLQLQRDGPAVAAFVPRLGDFVERSARRQRQGQRRRRVAQLAVLAALFFGFVPTGLFATFVQGPTLRRLEVFFDAANLANSAGPGPDTLGVGGFDDTRLQTLLRAAESLDSARTGAGVGTLEASQWLIDRLSWLPPVRRQADLLLSVGAQSEVPVNAQLRSLMGSSVWRARPRDDRTLLAAPKRITAKCLNEQAQAMPGVLYVAVDAGAPVSAWQRALFVPEQPATVFGLGLLSASFQPSSARCRAGAAVTSLPAALVAELAFDAGLNYLVLSLGSREGAPQVVVQEVDWHVDPSGQLLNLRRRTIASLPPAAVDRLGLQTVAGRVAPAATWPEVGGRGLDIGGSAWRVVATGAGRLSGPIDRSSLQALLPASSEQPCAQLLADRAPQPGWRAQAFAALERCVVVESGPAEPDDAQGSIEVSVALYPEPTLEMRRRVVAPIASVSAFARLGSYSELEAARWSFGVGGALAGWLVLDAPGSSQVEPGSGSKVAQAGPSAQVSPGPIGLPLSTCALWRLGTTLTPALPGFKGACNSP